MHINAQQFWVNGPPPGIREGLVESGLVVPQAMQKQFKKPIRKSTLSTSERNFSRTLPNRLLPVKNPDAGKHPTSFNHMKLQYPKQTNINQTNSNPLVFPPKIQCRAQTAVGCAREENKDIFDFESTKKTDDFDFFGDSPKKKSFISRKESKSLFDQINRLSQLAENEIEKIQPSLDTGNTEEDITGVLCSYLEKFYLLWDELILQIKVSNADHATALCLIKSYMQNVMKSLPNIAKRYENQIAQIQDTLCKVINERDSLKEENNDLCKQGEVDRNKIEEHKNAIISLNQELEKSQSEKRDLLFQIDELRQIQAEASYRVTKLEETRKQMTQTIEADTQKLGDIMKQNSGLEQLVKKYEDEGASYRPMYKKASEELQAAQSTIDQLKKEIEKLSYKPTLVDIETNTIQESTIKQEGSTKRKRCMTIKGERPKLIETDMPKINKKGRPISINNSSSSLKRSDLFSSSKNIPISADISMPLSLSTSSSVSSANVDLIPEAPIPEFPSIEKPPSPKKEKKEEEVTEKKEEAQNKEDNKEEDKKDTEDKKDEVVKQEEKKEEAEKMIIEEEVIIVNQDMQYPENYVYNPNLIRQMPALRTYLFRILPTAINEYRDSSDFYKIYSTNREIGVKSLTYTLGTAINILRNGFKFNRDPISEKMKFKDIIRQSLVDNGINMEILNKTEAILMTSSIHYRAVSKTIDFFLKFAAGEFSIADFGFFNMLFSLTYTSLYPAVDDVINDPDIADDSTSFLFPFEGIDRVCSILLPERMMTQQMKDELMKRSGSTIYKSMVSFWDFSTVMIELFDNVHQSFHHTVKNIFKSLGSNDVYNVSEARFTEFVRILFPNMDEKATSQSWKKVTLFANELSTDNVDYCVLLHFFGETPSFCESILKIPPNTCFEKQYREMQDRVDNLFTFLRKRYTDFIPRLKVALPEDLKKKVEPYIEKIRNALLRCDTGSVYVYYRHILLAIDIYLTEQNPYIQFTANVNPDEINDLINITITREKLVTERLFIK